MERILVIAIVSAAGVLGGGVAFFWAQREVVRRRNEFRMAQALRRGLANPDGIRQRPAQVLQWQACESH
jgi:hypothetical protein